ncbi:MAG: hypothetical protein SYR96_25955 [Actinomycetota bacterium]|nr:hypothetical protein [Actinomycetota bacterium]
MRARGLIMAAALAMVGQFALFAGPATAEPAATAPAACVSAAWQPVRSGLYLWRCPTSYHGQVVGGLKGDQLYLRSGAGTITKLVNIPATGNYNTGTVGDFGGPWAACLKIPNRAEVCTAHAW